MHNNKMAFPTYKSVNKPLTYKDLLVTPLVPISIHTVSATRGWRAYPVTGTASL